MNEIEDNIFGQLLFYEQTRALLTRINPLWFEQPLNRKVIKLMIEMYYTNIPIDYITIGKHISKKELLRVVEIGQNVHQLPNVSHYLPQLEQSYLKKNLVSQIACMDLTDDLKIILENMQGLIDNTKFTTINDPRSIQDVTNNAVDTITDSIKRGDRITGRPTGWITLDKALGGWNKGDLIVMAARPGQGKTALALSLMYEFAKIKGKGLFISLEMSSEQLAKRYLSLICNLANWKIRNATLKDNEVDYMCNQVNNSTINFFVDDDPNCSIQQIKAKAKIHKAKHGLELLIIDYIQLIKGTKQNREQEIAEISRNLKLLAKELNITVVVLAQLSRKCEERSDKRPMLSDIRESGSIEQDADVVLFPFRPVYYTGERLEEEEAEVIISKNRHGECFTIKTKFVGSRTMFTEML